MPTVKEMDALLNLKGKEDYTWEEFGEVAGVRITRKSTGAVLLLPAAGYYEDTSILWVKSAGLYWNADGWAISGGFFDAPYNAGSLFVNNGTYGTRTGYNPRNRGYSIRPVTE